MVNFFIKGYKRGYDVKRCTKWYIPIKISKMHIQHSYINKPDT